MLRLKLLLVVTLCYFSTVSSGKVKVPKIKLPAGNNRIIGGEPAEIENYPYQVSYSTGFGGNCGGFIISENYILTAAHCVRLFDPADVVVRAGSALKNEGTIIPIAEATPHPGYNTPRFDKDVAVLKTAGPIQFTENIQPVQLPEKNRPLLENSMVTVSGWGKTEQGASTSPEQLMHVEIPVMSGATCWSLYSTTWTQNMWCAGNFELGGTGTCSGDSGGAAVQDGIAVGVDSFGRGCGQAFAPSVFVNLAAPTIRDFITEQTGF